MAVGMRPMPPTLHEVERGVHAQLQKLGVGDGDHAQFKDAGVPVKNQVGGNWAGTASEELG